MKLLNKVALAFLLVLVLSCSTDTANTEAKINPPSLPKRIQCDSCNYVHHIINQVNHSNSDISITTPVAIGFFNNYRLIMKYDNSANPDLIDSLPEHLRTRDRQKIYKTLDLRGMYGAYVKPQLEELKVPLIEVAPESSRVGFKVNGEDYVIDLNYFLENDGVIIYSPGKHPILWENKLLNNDCDIQSILYCYFEN